MKVVFKTALRVEETENGFWELTTPFYVTVFRDAQTPESFPTHRIVVDNGFVTDFCSVPRMPFTYLLMGGIGNRAGVLHDWLYSIECREAIEREEADAILKEALAVCGVSWGKRFLMHAAVRMFGAAYWKKSKKKLP